MILVTLGTNDKTFIRLIKEIERLIETGVIQEQVVVQAGYTEYESKTMEIFDLIPYEKFDDLISSCSLLITHGGVGSIITGLKNQKRVIAVPRLEEYGEHVNNHQKEIIRNFNNAGYIIGISGVEELEAAIEKAKTCNTFLSLRPFGAPPSSEGGRGAPAPVQQHVKQQFGFL